MAGEPAINLKINDYENLPMRHFVCHSFDFNSPGFVL